MNPGRFYIPRTGVDMGPMLGSGYFPVRGNIGLFGRITNSLKNFNWSNLLNGANKTLNVVNQTIPLVRQAGPMFNNMKSMFRIARAFGSETNNKNNIPVRNNNIINNNVSRDTKIFNSSVNSNEEIISSKKEVVNNNYPNFFI